MTTFRRSAVLIGSFFILSNVVFLLGAVIFLEPILIAPDALSLAATHRTEIVLGALLELVNAFAYLGIAVVAFPILRRRYESLALAYFGFRVLEFVMQILADLSPLVLVSLGGVVGGESAPDAGSFQAATQGLLSMRMWAFHMISITMGSGALLFYSMLYRTDLIPRWISIWGLAGALVVLANTLFEMFGVSLPNLGFLMLANELFVGGWLIIRGFKPAAVAELAAT
jgi:hypothetical protein